MHVPPCHSRHGRLPSLGFCCRCSAAADEPGPPTRRRCALHRRCLLRWLRVGRKSLCAALARRVTTNGGRPDVCRLPCSLAGWPDAAALRYQPQVCAAAVAAWRGQGGERQGARARSRLHALTVRQIMLVACCNTPYAVARRMASRRCTMPQRKITWAVCWRCLGLLQTRTQKTKCAPQQSLRPSAGVALGSVLVSRGEIKELLSFRRASVAGWLHAAGVCQSP